jgi:hypothetical protein
VLGSEAPGYVDMPLCVTCGQVNPEQRDQDSVTMECFKSGNIQVKPTTHAGTLAPLSLTDELFRSQQIDLTEGIPKRQQIQTRPSGPSMRTPNTKQPHTLIHRLP